MLCYAIDSLHHGTSAYDGLQELLSFESDFPDAFSLLGHYRLHLLERQPTTALQLGDAFNITQWQQFESQNETFRLHVGTLQQKILEHIERAKSTLVDLLEKKKFVLDQIHNMVLQKDFRLYIPAQSDLHKTFGDETTFLSKQLDKIQQRVTQLTGESERLSITLNEVLQSSESQLQNGADACRKFGQRADKAISNTHAEMAVLSKQLAEKTSAEAASKEREAAANAQIAQLQKTYDTLFKQHTAQSYALTEAKNANNIANSQLVEAKDTISVKVT